MRHVVFRLEHPMKMGRLVQATVQTIFRVVRYLKLKEVDSTSYVLCLCSPWTYDLQFQLGWPVQLATLAQLTVSAFWVHSQWLAPDCHTSWFVHHLFPFLFYLVLLAMLENPRTWPLNLTLFFFPFISVRISNNFSLISLTGWDELIHSYSLIFLSRNHIEVLGHL